MAEKTEDQQIIDALARWFHSQDIPPERAMMICARTAALLAAFEARNANDETHERVAACALAEFLETTATMMKNRKERA